MILVHTQYIQCTYGLDIIEMIDVPAKRGEKRRKKEKKKNRGRGLRARTNRKAKIYRASKLIVISLVYNACLWKPKTETDCLNLAPIPPSAQPLIFPIYAPKEFWTLRISPISLDMIAEDLRGKSRPPLCKGGAGARDDGRNNEKKISTLGGKRKKKEQQGNYCRSPSTKSNASALLTTTTALLFRSYLTP